MFGKHGAVAWQHLTGAVKGLPNVGQGFVGGLQGPQRMMASKVIAGAGTGAAVGAGTGAIDRDRRAVPGAFGGAFWGAAAGFGGHAAFRHASAVGRRAMGNIPRSNKAARMGAKATMERSLAFSSGRRNAAALVGAYGAFNFTQGQSRRKKHYTTFHHGETGRR